MIYSIPPCLIGWPYTFLDYFYVLTKIFGTNWAPGLSIINVIGLIVLPRCFQIIIVLVCLTNLNYWNPYRLCIILPNFLMVRYL